MGDRLGIRGVVGNFNFKSAFSLVCEAGLRRRLDIVLLHRLRPYHVENTSSRLITEVKQHWAMLVLGWVTAWEYVVS